MAGWRGFVPSGSRSVLGEPEAGPRSDEGRQRGNGGEAGIRTLPRHVHKLLMGPDFWRSPRPCHDSVNGSVSPQIRTDPLKSTPVGATARLRSSSRTRGFRRLFRAASICSGDRRRRRGRSPLRILGSSIAFLIDGQLAVNGQAAQRRRADMEYASQDEVRIPALRHQREIGFLP